MRSAVAPKRQRCSGSYRRAVPFHIFKDSSISYSLRSLDFWIIFTFFSPFWFLCVAFGFPSNQSMVLAMSCISVLGSLVWGHHIYTLGLEADTRAYFTAVTMMISLPTGTKVFNWLCTVLGNALLITVSSEAMFALIFLVLFTLGGSTGVILGNAAMDVALHDTYYVIAHFHFVLSLGAIIALFLGVLYFQETIFASHSFIPSSTSRNAGFHFLLSFFGILLTFTPMHFLGFNIQPRRIPDFPDNFNSWNILSSIGSGLTLFAILFTKIRISCGLACLVSA